MQSKFSPLIIPSFNFLPLVKKYKFKHLLLICITISNLLGVSYTLLTWNCLNPQLLVILFLALNIMSLIALYHHCQIVKSRIAAKKAMIEVAFEAIHNGPLQSLDRVLRIVKNNELTISLLVPELELELEKINTELRGLYEFWQQESLKQEEKLYLGNNIILNLQDPLHEILYQVYSHTLERDFPCFQSIKLKIRSFEPVDESSLTLENKRGICRFLEEALCNVGKYATGVTCLKVTCYLSVGWYTLSIIDDGLGVNSSKEGWGTQQFKNLARQINGKFQRIPIYPQGTICELSWPKYLISYSR